MEARIAVLETKIASMKEKDDQINESYKNLEESNKNILASLQKLTTKTEVQSIKSENISKDLKESVHRIKKLEDKNTDKVAVWKKNTMALATIITSALASIYFKMKP